MKKPTNKALMTVFLIVLMDLLGFGIILPLLPFIAERFGAKEFEIGLLAATYSLFQFISAPIMGRLSDKFGRKPMLIVSQLGSAVGYVLLGLSGNMILIFISRIIDGFTGGNISIAQAYIADVTEPKDRAKGMGLIGAAFGIGFIFGPAIGGLLSKFGFEVPALFAAFIALITTTCTALFLKETVNVKVAQKSERTKFSFKAIQHVLSLETVGLMVGTFFLLNIAQTIMQGMFALYSQHTFNIGPDSIGLIFAYMGIMSVIMQLKVLPWLIKKWGERISLTYATLIWSIGFFALPLITNPLYLAFIFPLFAIGSGVSNPTIQAIASEKVRKEEYGETMGIIQSFGSLGRIIGPILGGELFAILGSKSPFFTGAGLIFFVFLWYFKAFSGKKTVHIASSSRT